MLYAYKELQTILVHLGLRPNLQSFDNKVPDALI